MVQRLGDAELVALHRSSPDSDEGRRAAAEILRRYRTAVYGWCRRYVSDPELALDLSQEVLLRAFENLRHFEGRSGVAAWLMAITRNRCLSEGRKRRIDEDDEFDVALLPSPRSDPLEALERREGEDELLTLVNENLDSLERKALWMRCVDELPVATITRLLAIEDTAGARTVLQRARRKLRRALGHEVSEETP